MKQRQLSALSRIIGRKESPSRLPMNRERQLGLRAYHSMNRIMCLLASLFVCVGTGANAQSTTFSYTGSVQTYTVASTGTLAIDMTGGQGGDGGQLPSIIFAGGLGGRVQCSLSVTAGQVLYINVGGKGIITGDAGGGVHQNSAANYGGDGGSASDIRIGGTTLTHRVVVAGAGGGGSAIGGGAGGGLTAEYALASFYSAQGGKQSAGGVRSTYSTIGVLGSNGTLGKGGDAGKYDGSYGGAGGGGGYYGGGGSTAGGGGGGSSYTDPTLVTGVTHTQGYQSGNGYVVITSTCTTPTVVTTGGGAICLGAAATLTASGATTYSWAPSTGLSATTGVSVSASPTTTTTYTVTGTSSGCSGVSTVTVTVNPVPASITVPGSSVLSVTTISGVGLSNGYNGDGPATAAQMNQPTRLVMDGSGNIYVADAYNYRVRKISTSGTMTTIAGNGSSSSSGDGGAATAAGVDLPMGIAVDGSNNVYVAEWAGRRIRKINAATGIITTVAGNGSYTSAGDGGQATAAALQIPAGVAFDGSGNMYISEQGGHSIRKVNGATGVISTIAGNAHTQGYTGDGGAATAAQLNNPVGMAVDAAGNVYFADRDNYVVRKINTSGIISTVAGTGTVGAWDYVYAPGALATATPLYYPRDVSVDGDGNLYISVPDRLLKVNTSGVLSVIGGGGSAALSDGASATSVFLSPLSSTVSSSGDIYVLSHSCRTVKLSATSVAVCAGSSATMVNATSGGTWSSSNGNVTVGSTSGVVTGVTAGTSVVSYILPEGCYKTTVVTVNALPSVSAGSGVTICTGSSTTLTATGATTYSWSPSTGLSSTTGASVSASPTSTTTYTVTGTNTNGCSNTATVTVSVNSTPPASTGQTFTCAGGGITLSNAVSGGTWSSSNTSIATVGSLSGVVTGVAAGTVNITYALGTGCFTVSEIDVNPPMPVITGTTNVCIGTTTDLDDSMAGGTWSTSSTYYGSVDPTTGVVTGIHPGGYTTVTYSVNSGCNTSTSVYTSNIVLSIAGSLTTCVGSVSTLSVPGYPGATWVTPDSATAFINSTSGAMLGIAAGTVPVTVNYGYCFTTATASVNPVPASITGGSEVCMGSTLALACSTGGGAWSSSNTAKATVDGSGAVTGMSSGTATISYALGTGCAATKVVTVGGMPAAISGTTTLCEGATTTLSCTSTGGTWSSSATGTADVTSTTVTGVASYATISGIAVGGATISYSYPGGCVQTVNVTVAAPPASIGGTLDICIGGTSTLTGGGGGTWSSSTTTVATVGSSTGIATGSSAGTSTITYRTSATCYTTSVVTVSVPAAISGAASVCKTYTTTFTHAVGGGTWTSSNAAVASVDASGVVTGVLAGSATITYNISTGCYAVKTIYVYNNPTAITGTASVCAGSNTTLTGATGTTAVWSSSNGSVATVGSSSGVVSGVAAGNADITFTATATGCFSTRNVTVNEAPTAITGASTLCVGADETYMSTPTGGAWASTSPTVGSINGTTGTATGRAAGGTYIKYTLSNGCYVLKAVTVTALPGGITGTSIVCVGNSVVLSAASSGSTWSTSAAGTASITATTASTATVAGISAGVANISYSNAAGCSRIYAVTVNAAVADIAGDDIVCSTGTITLTDATAGGTWSSNATTKVSVATYTGIATGGATLGTAVITYKVGAGCYTTKSITNNAALPNILGGGTNMCSGADGAVTLTNAVSGGTWSSSNTSVAVVDGSTGVVTGVLMGGSNTYVYITYATSAGCTKSRAILIKPQPIITGADEVSVGATTTMTGSPTGGSWGSSSAATAAISGYGVVTGVAAGSATISYTLAGCANTKGITVTGAASRPAGMTEEAVTLFSVFPNPSHGSLSVSTGVAGTFTIYTVDGKVAAMSELTEGVNAINMPTNMAAGTYLCRFNGTDGSVQSVRLVYEP
ncbi:MAG: Ig-like domain-containing protein [Taibaiella sp.]|nr:Ig-like domain-containing protein [Taibaiella sp.]